MAGVLSYVVVRFRVCAKLVPSNTACLEFWNDDRYLDIGLIASFDGGRLFKRNHVDVWPIWAVNLNLPPSQRYAQDELLLLGLYVGSSKPPMNAFLRHLVNHDLCTKCDDIRVTDHTGQRHHCRVRLLCVTADLPARVQFRRFISEVFHGALIFCLSHLGCCDEHGRPKL